MAITQEQIQDAFDNAINLGISLEMDDTTLISRITGYEVSEEETEQNAVNRRKALDRIYINGKSITSMLGEGNNYSFADYIKAIREALSPENNSFVTVMSDNFLDQRAVMAVARPLSNEDIDYSDPETWFETEERHNEIQNKQNKLEEAMRNKASASINYSASYNENSAGAIQKAIKATLSDNDIDLIKSISGLDELNDENIRKALDSIYIDGKNLTDKLGRENENNIAAYAGAIRSALSFDNDSFITIMNRNSIMANPRAVIINAPENSSPEVRATAERKAVASLHYTVNYKIDARENILNAEKRLTDRAAEDNKLFFASLFNNGEDISSYDNERLTHDIYYNYFQENNIMPDFVTSRLPEQKVYNYMLTLDYPSGSGNKLTLEQIMNDDSQEMKDFKKQAGKDFCNLFLKIPDGAARTVNGVIYNDNTKFYNEVTVPKMIEMSEAALHIRTGYHDLSEKDDLENAVFDRFKLDFMVDMTQQLGDANIGVMPKGAVLFNISILSRYNYMKTDSYIDGTINRSGMELPAKYQMYVDDLDTNDLKTICSSSMATIDPYNENKLYELDAAIMSRISLDEGLLQRYQNGEDLSDIVKLPDHKKIMRETAIQLERDKDKADGDLTLLRMSKGTGGNMISFDRLWGIYRNQGVQRRAEQNDAQAENTAEMTEAERREADRRKRVAAEAEDIYSNARKYGNKPDKDKYDGFRYSLLGELTSCFTIDSEEGRQAVSPEKLKAQYMAAVSTVYVNDKSVAEKFGLNENNILDRIDEVDHELCEILMKSMDNVGNEYLFVKNGHDSFSAVEIEGYYNSTSKIGFTDYNRRDPESSKLRQNAVETLKVRNEIRNEKFNAARVFADVMSGRADKESIEKYSDVFKAKGMDVPSVNIRLDFAMGILSQNETGSVLYGLLGRKLTTPQEFEDAAKNIYIGNHTLAELCQKGAGTSDEECTAQREQLLKDNIKNLFENNSIQPQAMYIRDAYGTLKPLKVINMDKPPVEPKQVKLYTDFQKHFHMDSTIDENRRAYDAYVAEKERYDSYKAFYDKCTKYNASLEDTRLKIIKEERSGPAQRTMNIMQAQMTNGMAVSPALTQPTAQRGAAQNERTAQH